MACGKVPRTGGDRGAVSPEASWYHTPKLGRLVLGLVMNPSTYLIERVTVQAHSRIETPGDRSDKLV